MRYGVETRIVGMALAAAVRVWAMGYGHGTAGAILTSPGVVVAAIDSKEVDREFLSDGTTVTETRLSCKARRAGPFIVLVAGISRASDGFNALQVAAGLYRGGDSLDDFAARLAAAIPERLTPIVSKLREADRAGFDRTFAHEDVLQLSVLGADGDTPRAVVVSFPVRLFSGGAVSVEGHRTGCPGDCRDRNTVYLMGVREAEEDYLYAHPEMAGDISAETALALIHLEYESQPAVAGGPETVIRVTGSGAAMEQGGVCPADSGVSGLEDSLDATIHAVENVVVHEDVAQYSQKGSSRKATGLAAEVRVVEGNEEYTWSGVARNRLPQPWCGGELATMLRATLLAVERGEGSVTAATGGENDAAVEYSFHANGEDQYWQLMVGGATYPLAFEGRVWFSRTTGEVERIRWTSTALRLPASTGITQVEWDETFSGTEIAGVQMVTPRTAMYRVRYAESTQRTDWTETRFSEFRRYGSTATVQFAEAGIR